MQVFWEETHDPKFLRQQTRVILALARLGVVPGAIDAVAPEDVADTADDGIWDTNPADGNAHRPAGDNGTPIPDTSRPPVGDCSQFSAPSAELLTESSDVHDVTAAETDTYDENPAVLEEDRKELILLERRLLVVLDGMPPGDVERRQAMEKRWPTSAASATKSTSWRAAVFQWGRHKCVSPAAADRPSQVVRRRRRK